MLMIINTFSPSMLAGPSTTVSFRQLTLVEARQLIRQTVAVSSAIGHESTAVVFSQFLGIQLPANRVAMQLKYGDSALLGQLSGRLPEGKVLSSEELLQLSIRWMLVQVTSEGQYHCHTCRNELGVHCQA